MNIHFICRGNVLRSLIAETYLKSLGLTGVLVSSSGTSVDLNDPQEQLFLATTKQVLARHGLAQFAKVRPDQLTQERANGQDLTVCMNQRVVDEARSKVKLPANVLSWNITDIGEGARTGKFENGRELEEVIYDEVVAKVDELLRTLGR